MMEYINLQLCNKKKRRIKLLNEEQFAGVFTVGCCWLHKSKNFYFRCRFGDTIVESLLTIIEIFQNFKRFFRMLQRVNLFEWRHLFAISDLLLSMFLFLSLIITNFSVVHRSHLFDDGRQGEHFFSIDQAISNCWFWFFNSQIY